MNQNNFQRLAVKIKLLISDVDGVLTDGKILISSNGSESKFFNVEDGTGAALAYYADLPIALISGRFSECTSIRANELNIKHCFQNTLNKTEKLHELMNIYSAEYEEIAYIGDSLVDIPVMKLVALPIAVPNAQDLNKKHSVYITEKSGGEGVLLEVVEKILMFQNRYKEVLDIMEKDKF